ncbi:MAG: putative rane protein [Herbinix sp.]|nr:putative rane protein [Herbinix sp.]
MKLYHYILIYMLIAVVTVIVLDIETNDLKAIIANKEMIDKNLNTALDDGISRLTKSEDKYGISINKDAAMQSFFQSLETSFGVLSDPKAIEKLTMYIPVVAITMEDGFYVFHSDTIKELEGVTTITKRWSEKIPYYYEDNDFIYGFTLGDVISLYDKNGILSNNGSQKYYKVDYHDLSTKVEYSSFRSKRPNSFLLSAGYDERKKGILIKVIEKSLAYYTSKHNRIATQYGITYNFSLPTVNKDDWELYLETNSMFVVFQGYPYGTEARETYNRIVSAGAKISKKNVYYLEQKDWYLIYHKDTCEELGKNGILFMEAPYYEVKECVKAGAYACPICSSEGVSLIM